SNKDASDKDARGPRRLPYRATTASGNVFDFEFALHPQTASAVQVANVLGAILGAVDREIKLQGQIGNGDVLQALCMAVAVRARMLGGNQETVTTLAGELLASALDAKVEEPPSNLPTDGTEPVH
ncbi:MAG: hypothetical protein AAF648_14020, partial [Pseudomonadota bacterium]